MSCVGAGDPARELDRHQLEAHVGVVFALQSRLDHLELQPPDGAEDRVPLAPLVGRWLDRGPPARAARAAVRCFPAPQRVHHRRRARQCSGAKLGISSKENFFPAVRVSPISKIPGVVDAR